MTGRRIFMGVISYIGDLKFLSCFGVWRSRFTMSDLGKRNSFISITLLINDLADKIKPATEEGVMWYASNLLEPRRGAAQLQLYHKL